MTCWRCPAPAPSGRRCLPVYAVKTTTDSDNPQEVATIDDEQARAILTDIFWEMNQISSRTETQNGNGHHGTSDDGNGNIVETETTVTQTYLYITVSHKTAEEMAAQYGFDEEQKEQTCRAFGRGKP